MNWNELTVGFGITGSFCTFHKVEQEIQKLKEAGASVIPVFSNQAQLCDTRFGAAEDFMDKVEKITERKIIRTICEAEPVGPKKLFDVMVIAPCTGNTAAKLSNGITDTPVLMAAKAHLRNGRPLVIALATNDALAMNFKNIGMLMNMKQIYFVPFGQDNSEMKPNSMIADMTKLQDSIEAALGGRQLQPVIQSP